MKRLAEIPGEEAFLHLLRCPYCRDLVLAQYDAQRAGSAPAPPAPRKKAAVSKEAEWLFDGLMRLSSQKRIEATKDPRYHRADLLELILERSEEAQAKDVNRADELAWLAIALATNIDADDVRLRKHLVRGFCLAGNARRMAGDRCAAESAFDNASFFLAGDPLERGLYCRALALLRWDQGRLDEAAALLRYAASAYGEKEDSLEEGACLALLGLLHMEAEDYFPAMGPLLRAQLALAPARRHDWLLARSHLSLLLCLAEEGRREEVRELLGAALDVEAMVEGEEERARIDWLRGRIDILLGQRGRGERLIDAARRMRSIPRSGTSRPPPSCSRRATIRRARSSQARPRSPTRSPGRSPSSMPGRVFGSHTGASGAGWSLRAAVGRLSHGTKAKSGPFRLRAARERLLSCARRSQGARAAHLAHEPLAQGPSRSTLCARRSRTPRGVRALSEAFDLVPEALARDLSRSSRARAARARPEPFAGDGEASFRA